jgi:hypothetical protein
VINSWHFNNLLFGEIEKYIKLTHGVFFLSLKNIAKLQTREQYLSPRNNG